MLAEKQETLPLLTISTKPLVQNLVIYDRYKTNLLEISRYI